MMLLIYYKETYTKLISTKTQVSEKVWKYVYEYVPIKA